MEEPVRSPVDQENMVKINEVTNNPTKKPSEKCERKAVTDHCQLQIGFLNSVIGIFKTSTAR